jgi:hypothetical protein
MYELLVGLPPYYANNREELFHNIESAALKIPSFISTEGKNLLKAVNNIYIDQSVAPTQSCQEVGFRKIGCRRNQSTYILQRHQLG